MSFSSPSSFSYPTIDQLDTLSQNSFNYTIPPHQLSAYLSLVSVYLKPAEWILQQKQPEAVTQQHANNTIPPSPLLHTADHADETQQQSSSNSNSNTAAASLSQPRSFTVVAPTYKNNERISNGWTTRCNLKSPTLSSSSSTSLPLANKTLVLKDTIPLSQVPMFCGMSHSFIPAADSILVTRCLAAGAIIIGKATCEYMCTSGCSHANAQGIVSNPYKQHYNAGGSSSGCAVLVARGEVDLSLGCDQGGSCRIPAAFSGVVGMKPTWGLVPYTNIEGFYADIDHCGPITANVTNNALLLSAIAGWDGLDARASKEIRRMQKIDYVREMQQGVHGLRVGLVIEGFNPALCEPDVARAVRDAALLLTQHGAIVSDVSIPMHPDGRAIWRCASINTLQAFFHSTHTKHSLALRDSLLADVAAWSVPFRVSMLAAEWMRTQYPHIQQLADALTLTLREAYANTLSQYDLLVMPTLPCKATLLPPHLCTALEYESATAEMIESHGMLKSPIGANTSTANLTHHPACSVPVGMGRCVGDEGGEGDWLPIGMMFIADHLQESVIYRAAYKIEELISWKENKYDGDQKI